MNYSTHLKYLRHNMQLDIKTISARSLIENCNGCIPRSKGKLASGGIKFYYQVIKGSASENGCGYSVLFNIMQKKAAFTEVTTALLRVCHGCAMA